MDRKRIVVWTSILSAVVLVSGCQETLTYERFQMIREDVSTHDDVERTLGPPEHKVGDVWSWTDFDRHLTCNVYFDPQGKVAKKEWIDADRGTWEGSAPSIE